jgi:acylphosphatase
MAAPDVAPSDASGRVRRRVLVAGLVQGVWFRESCREQAAAAGLGGWVRNRGDGRVEAVLEGPPAAVDRVVAWCARGPRRARVDGVEVTTEAPVGEHGFRVR